MFQQVAHSAPNYERIELTKESLNIIHNSESFNKLRIPINSTLGYSKLYNQFKLSRFDHSVHSAKQAHLLKNSNLTDYEIKCLELALLLHDLGHTLGSHSIDKLYSLTKNRPEIEQYGYSKQDYHEYHTVELLTTPEFKKLFKDHSLLADVISILSHHDIRPLDVKAPGIHSKPRLSKEQTAVLYELKDWLDRVSYLELEYLLSKANKPIVESAMQSLNNFRNTLTVEQDVLLLNETHTLAVIELRKRLFGELVYHPLSMAYDEYIRRNVVIKDITYEQLKSLATASAETLFTKPLFDLLTQRSNACLSDRLIPLLTIDHDFLTSIGKAAFQPIAEPGFKNLTKDLLKRDTYTSYAELLINLKIANSRHLYVLSSPTEMKNFTFFSKTSSNEIKYLELQSQEFNDPVVVIATDQTHSSKVLDDLHKDIVNIFKQSRWIPKNLDADKILDANIFKRRANIIFK